MAAIYSGIHLKLKSPQTPWEDKLKLARFAWISSQCLLPNKEQVLLDWCTHALTLKYNKKVEFSQDVLEGLWHYLDDVLHSRKLQSHLKQGKTITLRLNMAQMLLERLQECANADSKHLVSVPTILSVCQGIISSPALSSVFTTKYELMVDLLAKICSLACRELQQPLLSGHQKTSEPIMNQDELVSECLQTESVVHLENPQIELISAPSKPKKKLQTPNVFEVLLQVLSCYLSVQRQQANPNRVFTMVTNQLIQPLVLLRHLLTSGEFTVPHTHLRLHQQLCRDMRTKIDCILQLALFPLELLTLYKDELLPTKKDSGKRASASAKGPLKPVSVALCKLSAQGYCEPSLHYPVKSNTLSLLFKFFLERYGKLKGGGEDENKMLCFYFLTRLVPVLDLHLAQYSVSTAEAEPPGSVFPQQKSPSLSLSSPESWSLALLAVESLLSQTLSADIYNVAADRIRHGEVQLGFYRALTQLLFNEAQPSVPSWYRCLKVLLNLNHLILEPDLDQLLSSAWVNAECMEPRVQRARQLMVCSLLQTYAKLRQLSRLFSELLSVICQPALDDLRPPLLPEGISTSLRTCLLGIPQSQVLEICSLVLESIKKYILPDLLKEGTDAEKMEIDGQPTDQEKIDASLKLSSLSQLLHAVLFNLKTLDNSSPVPLVRQSQDMMERMQQLVQELHFLTENKSKQVDMSSVNDTKRNDKKCPNQKESEKISQTKKGSLWEQRTLEAAFLLRYTWIEVDTLFEIHCSKYSSPDSANSTVKTGDQSCPNSFPVTRIESLLSGDISPAHLHPSPSSSPMTCLLLKLLTLQQIKKILMDSTSCGEPATAALLQRAAQFILATPGFEMSLGGEHLWDLQIGSLNVSSYPVAHWYLVVSNLPLIISHLSVEDIDCVADVLVGSLLKREIYKSKDQQLDSLTVSLISSDFLQSSVLPELPSLFSAVVKALALRIIHEAKAGHPLKICRTLQMFREIETGFSERNVSYSLSTLVKNEILVEDVQASIKTGEASLLLSNTNFKELVNILQILTKLNPDGMSSEDLSSIFLLLFSLLTFTSNQLEEGTPEDGNLFLRKLLRTLAYLLGSRNIHSVLKVIYGATLLQASVSSLLWHGRSANFEATCSADWLDLIKAMQDFIKSLVQLIITRNNSARLNLDQFTTYLSNAVVASRKSTVPSSGASIASVHLLLACLASFSQTMTSNLGRNNQMDQTLTQMLARTNVSLGPTAEFVLKQQAASQPACILGQAFIVDVVTVMLHCELSSLSVEEENKPCATLSHMSLYQGFCHQIFREISSAPRPMDFLVSSLHFLSAFYKAVEETERETKTEQEEVKKAGHEEVYVQILQTVHRLLKAPWLSEEDFCKLEPVVQELFCQLLEKSSADKLNVLLLMVRDGLDIGKLRAGNYREVLSAVIIIKLLSCCPLPESCSKALWLIAPQIISAMVSLVRTSSQDVCLTLPFTLPTVTSMTTLLRQGEGLIRNLHHVVLVLGALQSVPLNHTTPRVYQLAFLAVHEALFAILQCHPQVVLNAAPSFLNVFNRLLASIMQEGRQRGDGDSGSDTDVYVQCSRLIERMYSHIAAAAESFTMLSAFMVAQYVTELQKVTLCPDVKLHLTEGVYYILDLCKEQDIKFLMAGLQMGVREVFNELYSSYTHYHKTQRQGEDKYTV